MVDDSKYSENPIEFLARLERELRESPLTSTFNGSVVIIPSVSVSAWCESLRNMLESIEREGMMP